METDGTVATEAPRASSLVAAYNALLRDDNALVAAFGEDGIFVPIPPTVKVSDERVMPGRWALDVVLPAEGSLVISTWDRLQEVGGARALVHLKADPETPVVMQFLDARAEHGVYLGFFQAAEGTSGLDAGVVAASAPVAPRLAVIRKNELATMVHVDEATTRMFGWTAEELVGRRSLELIHPDDHERAINSWMETLGPWPDAPRALSEPDEGRHVAVGRVHELQLPRRPRARLRGRGEHRHLRRDGGPGGLAPA